MHLVTAPRPGTGKSYLADIASMIATGDRCAVKPASPNAEETEKRLVGAALSGRPIIALDNCRDVLRGDFLCQVTERPLLELRALGKSDQHRIPNTFSFFANGNKSPSPMTWCAARSGAPWMPTAKIRRFANSNRTL